jgi:cob(I)alamin adenosyltransferase
MNTHYKDTLAEIQDRLFTIGAILATPQEKRGEKNGELRLKNLGILETDIELLENEIDSMENELPEMTHFVYWRPHYRVTLSYCTMRMPCRAPCCTFKPQ